jgi:hypothetical protein
MPDESALGAEAERDADRRCSARYAAVRRRGRQHGDARCSRALEAASQRKKPSHAIAAYAAEMLSRTRHMTADTMANTEMFYAPDAADRVVAVFRKFGGAEPVPPAADV